MNDKEQLVTMLKEEFHRWEERLAGLNDEQVTTRSLPSELSVKDVVGHLRAWQQVSIARLEAALHDRQPDFAGWGKGLEPDADENLEKINAWIHETYLDQPWERVHSDWREGFLRFLELAEAMPEKELFQEGSYAWLGTYPLSAVLEGSDEHHREHREELQAWLDKHEALF